MANPTTNFGWVMPTSTDLVTDLPADFAVFGQGVDTSMADLKGGTTGQILAKATNTDMDFTWITNDQGDITGVTAGTGLSGGGTSGAISLAIDTATTVDKTTAQTLTNKTLTSPVLTTPTISTLTTNGDILYGTGSGALSRLGIGSTGQVLKVAGGVPTWGADQAGKVLQVVTATYATSTSNSSATYADTGLTATITPTSNTSKILVLVFHNGISKSAAVNYQQMSIKVVRASTDILVSSGINYTAVANDASTAWAASILDSPATTSATTYKTTFNSAGVASVTIQNGNQTSTITLLEIGA